MIDSKFEASDPPLQSDHDIVDRLIRTDKVIRNRLFATLFYEEPDSWEGILNQIVELHPDDLETRGRLLKEGLVIKLVGRLSVMERFTELELQGADTREAQQVASLNEHFCPSKEAEILAGLVGMLRTTDDASSGFLPDHPHPTPG